MAGPADHQPQQSVLKPQSAHRQTACILKTRGLPQRSQTTASQSDADGRAGSGCGGAGWGGLDMGGL